MDIERIKSIFSLFTGQDDYERYLPIINFATVQVKNMLNSTADIYDIRLDMLAAAVANYRYVQIVASRMENISAYNGKMLVPDSNSNAVKYAERIVRDYMDICADMLKEQSVIINTGEYL